jgi:hypothetical protein
MSMMKELGIGIGKGRSKDGDRVVGSERLGRGDFLMRKSIVAFKP